MENILNRTFCKYDYVIVIGDYNANIIKIDTNSMAIKDFCTSFNLTNNVHKPTCFKEKNESLIDLILTNQSKRFLFRNVVDTGISDFHKLWCSTLYMWVFLSPNLSSIAHLENLMWKISWMILHYQPPFNCADDLDINIGMSKYIKICK